MLAFRLKLFLFVIASALTGCLILGVWAGYPLVGALICVAAFLLYPLILAVEFACLWCVEPAEGKPSVHDLARAWWQEAISGPIVFLWHQPFRSLVQPDHLPNVLQPGHGVLLVHGLVCNRGFWNSWTKRLHRCGIPFVAINLEPVFGPIEGYSTQIEAAVVRLESHTGCPPVIVAHSMGGLAVRYWFCQQPSADRVRRIITIGTPHAGTWMARFANARSGRQMTIASDWVRALSTQTTAAQAAAFTCFYGNCDNVVFPSRNGTLAGADNRKITRTAHVALAFEEIIFREAIRWARPGAPSTRRVASDSSKRSHAP